MKDHFLLLSSMIEPNWDLGDAVTTRSSKGEELVICLQSCLGHKERHNGGCSLIPHFDMAENHEVVGYFPVGSKELVKAIKSPVGQMEEVGS